MSSQYIERSGAFPCQQKMVVGLAIHIFDTIIVIFLALYFVFIKASPLHYSLLQMTM